MEKNLPALRSISYLRSFLSVKTTTVGLFNSCTNRAQNSPLVILSKKANSNKKRVPLIKDTITPSQSDE